ncbi:MAG TPA: amidohydrolase family protein [Thermoanaerobaculia bacterium]|nr:amidohydrolase family protein [Thermoanaerobaculia bacterium]
MRTTHRFRLRVSLETLGAALLLAAPAFSSEAAPRPARATAFVHVAVVPMDAPRVLRDQTVVVADGRIRALGPSASTAVPAGARVVDGRRRFLMPGLADMHAHLYAEEELTLHVVNGVTTVFNLNGRPAHLAWRRRVASGELLGPTIYTAGPTFDRPRTPEEAVAEVDRQAAAGYDAVKIYNQVSAAEYPALTAEAKKKGLLLVGHVAREPGFAMTLSAGQTIAHAEEYVYTYFNDDPDPRNEVVHPLDTMKIPGAVAMTREAGISVIPTLVAFHNIVRQATAIQDYLRDPNLVYLVPSMRAALEPDRNTYATRWPPERLPGLAMSYEFQRLLVKALHDGGVPILAGTDVSWLGVPGFSLVEEVENFQDLGFEPYAALRTATADAAKMLRRDGEFGTVAAGQRADLILLSRNPLDDVRALEKPVGVMAAGRWIPAAERERLLAGMPGAYRASLGRLALLAATDVAAADRELGENDPFGVLASSVLLQLAQEKGPAGFAAILARLHRENPKANLTSEDSLNQLGYDLYAAKLNDASIAVFRLNTELYPTSGNTFDSLAETYRRLGDEKQARAMYARALEVQPDYPNAKAARAIVGDGKP